MRKKRFLRRNTDSLSKLGKLRKKLQRWRKPKGRDNKMRLKERGRARNVEIGYKQPEKNRGKIQDKEPVFIKNIQDLENMDKNKIAIIRKMGQKKKIEIAKIAKEKNIQLANLNIEKTLKLEKKPKKDKPSEKVSKEKEEPKEEKK